MDLPDLVCLFIAAVVIILASWPGDPPKPPHDLSPGDGSDEHPVGRL